MTGFPGAMCCIHGALLGKVIVMDFLRPYASAQTFGTMNMRKNGLRQAGACAASAAAAIADWVRANA